MYIFVACAVWNCRCSLHTVFAVTGPPPPPAVVQQHSTFSSRSTADYGYEIAELFSRQLPGRKMRTSLSSDPELCRQFRRRLTDGRQSHGLWFFIMPGCLCTETSGQSVCFVLSRNTAAVAHKDPASPGTSRDSCHVRGNDNMKYVKCTSDKPVQISPPPESAVAKCYGFLVPVYETFQIKCFFSLVMKDLFNHSVALLELQMELLTYAMRLP